MGHPVSLSWEQLNVDRLEGSVVTAQGRRMLPAWSENNQRDHIHSKLKGQLFSLHTGYGQLEVRSVDASVGWKGPAGEPRADDGQLAERLRSPVVRERVSCSSTQFDHDVSRCTADDSTSCSA